MFVCSHFLSNWSEHSSYTHTLCSVFALWSQCVRRIVLQVTNTSFLLSCQPGTLIWGLDASNCIASKQTWFLLTNIQGILWSRGRENPTLSLHGWYIFPMPMYLLLPSLKLLHSPLNAVGVRLWKQEPVVVFLILHYSICCSLPHFTADNHMELDCALVHTPASSSALPPCWEYYSADFIWSPQPAYGAAHHLHSIWETWSQ